MRSCLSVFPLLILPLVSLAAGFFQSPILPRSLGSRAESDLPLTPDGNGICYQYAVQETDTCQSIAESHKMTPADIDAYNARVWRWPGCANISQGDFLCLSAGEPVMPVALAQATCGPQVPGTPRPNDYALLSSLNPCPANQCVSRPIPIHVYFWIEMTIHSHAPVHHRRRLCPRRRLSRPQLHLRLRRTLARPSPRRPKR